MTSLPRTLDAISLPLGLGLMVLLAACAHGTDEQAKALVQAGEYEKAVEQIDKALQRSPKDTRLKTAHARVHEDIAKGLTQQITTLRMAGQWDAALKLTQRARALGLQALDADALQAAIEQERFAFLEIQRISKSAQEGQLAQALTWAQQALNTAPQHRGLQALERQLTRLWRQQTPSPVLPQLKTGTPVTLELRQAPLAAALELISKSQNIQFVLDRDVRPDSPVTLFVRQAALPDVLDVLLGSQGLTRRILDEKTVLIFPNTQEKRREHQELVVRTYHLTHSDAKTVANMLRSTLRTAEPFIDERANLVTLRDQADVVALADRLVALHDSPDAEVMLEVEVLEVSRSRLMNLGINFPSTLTLTPLNSSRASTGLTLSDLENLNSSRIGASVSPLTLNLRRELGDGQVLANPSIRTKNREKAKIMIGDKVPVVTTSSSATGIVGQNITYLDVGLKLEAEPLISPDDEVTLKLSLEVSNITKTVQTGNGGTAYQIGTRNASTTLRLQDGETQLLGGLISKNDTRAAARIPGLGDLPVMGRLFGSQEDNATQTELVLSITPRILRPAIRPDLLQSMVRMGSEASPRLRASPWTTPAAPPALPAPAAAPGASGLPPGTLNNPNAPVMAPAAPQGPAAQGPQLVAARLAGPSESKVGEIITLSLDLDGAASLRSLPLQLEFKPGSFEVVDIRLGAWLTEQGPAQLSQAFNSSLGKLSLNLQLSGDKGLEGKGTVLQVQLRALSAGDQAVALSHFAPMGANGPLGKNAALPQHGIRVSP